MFSRTLKPLVLRPYPLLPLQRILPTFQQLHRFSAASEAVAEESISLSEDLSSNLEETEQEEKGIRPMKFVVAAIREFHAIDPTGTDKKHLFKRLQGKHPRIESLKKLKLLLRNLVKDGRVVIHKHWPRGIPTTSRDAGTLKPKFHYKVAVDNPRKNTRFLIRDEVQELIWKGVSKNPQDHVAVHHHVEKKTKQQKNAERAQAAAAAAKAAEKPGKGKKGDDDEMDKGEVVDQTDFHKGKHI